MADSSVVAAEATSLPSSDDLARAEKFTRERFVHPGEEAAEAIGPGSGRRHALDDALAEIEAGAKAPSPEGRGPHPPPPRPRRGLAGGEAPPPRRAPPDPPPGHPPAGPPPPPPPPPPQRGPAAG